MNIIKEFEDPEFLAISYNWVPDNNLKYEKFYWGLGDDGELYCKCTRFYDGNQWNKPSRVSNIQDFLTLKLMKRIVKQFGHLIIFT